MSAIGDQTQVTLEYTLTVDGKVVDASQGKGPLSYTHGKGQIIPGLERQLVGLKAGDEGDFVVEPEGAYGELNPEAVMQVPRDQLPQDVKPSLGQVLSGRDGEGHEFRARITGIQDDTVTMDLNHPLAGKTLNFHIKILTVTRAS